MQRVGCGQKLRVLTHVQKLHVRVTAYANSVCVCTMRVGHQFCTHVNPQR